MKKFEQRTIEHFFKKHGIKSQQDKAKFLPKITDLAYEYNMLVIRLDNQEDDYRISQINRDIEYILEKIENILKGKEK